MHQPVLLAGNVAFLGSCVLSGVPTAEDVARAPGLGGMSPSLGGDLRGFTGGPDKFGVHGYLFWVILPITVTAIANPIKKLSGLLSKECLRK